MLVNEMIARAVAQYSDCPAVLFDGQSRSFAQVASFSFPVAFSFDFFWKAFTAFSVRGPKTPSRTSPALLRELSSAWSVTTEAPFDPFFSAGYVDFFATGFVVGRSVTVADQHISAAWTQSVEPEEFAQSFLTFDDDDAGADDSSL